MDIDKLKSQLRQDEGFRSKPYNDTVGKCTVGYGRNLDDVGISIDEAELMLSNDIVKVQSDLDKNLPWWRTLNDVRQLVLADMCYNMGIGNAKHGLLSFSDTLRHIQRGEFQSAVDNLQKSLWHQQVGPRAGRLEKMLLTGEYL